MSDANHEPWYEENIHVDITNICFQLQCTYEVILIAHFWLEGVATRFRVLGIYLTMDMFIGLFFKGNSSFEIFKVFEYLMELSGPRERHTHGLRQSVVHFDYM